MVNKHRSRRSYNKDLRDEQLYLLENDIRGKQLLGLFGLSLSGEMRPKFGIGHAMLLDTYKDGKLETSWEIPTLVTLSEHLGFIEKDDIQEIQDLEIADKYRMRLLDWEISHAKDTLNKYLAKVRPLLLKRDLYFYTIPEPPIGTELETGSVVPTKRRRILCVLPLSRQVAEDYGCTQEEIKQLAPLVAWLLPELVRYGKIKNADKLLEALNGWTRLLTPQQTEKLGTSVEMNARPVINRKVKQLLLL